MWQNVIDNILHTGITAAERSSKDHNPAWPRSMIKWPGEPFLRVVVTYIAKQQQKKLKRIASTSQSLPELIPNLGERLKGRAVVSISHKLPFYKSFLTQFRNYCSTNLIFDKHVISILAPRFVLHVHVFCSQCLVIKFHSFPVRCLKDTSWKVATDEITYLPQSHLQLLPDLGERLKGRAVFSISHKLPFYKSFLVARGVKGLEGYLQIYKRLLKGRKLQHASGIIPIQTKI